QTDIRDVFMLLPQAKDKKWIKNEISQRYNLKERITIIIEKIDSRQFRDGLFGVFGSLDKNTFERHRKAVLSLEKDI
ncbi:MAG: hypothetical protein ABIG89_05250, partial [Candidatus Woesearchaeota archaeon]